MPLSSIFLSNVYTNAFGYFKGSVSSCGLNEYITISPWDGIFEMDYISMENVPQIRDTDVYNQFLEILRTNNYQELIIRHQIHSIVLRIVRHRIMYMWIRRGF